MSNYIIDSRWGDGWTSLKTSDFEFAQFVVAHDVVSALEVRFRIEGV